MDKKRLNIALLVSEFEDGYTRSLREGAVYLYFPGDIWKHIITICIARNMITILTVSFPMPQLPNMMQY